MHIFILMRKNLPGSIEDPWEIKEVFLKEETAEKTKEEILKDGPDYLKIEKYKINEA